MDEPSVVDTLSPSLEGADVSASIGDTENAVSFLTLICTCCGISFDPPQGEECYGKCQDCLSVHFNSFARLHVPDLVSFFVDAFPFPLQVAQPPGPDTGIGSPPGDSPAPVVSPDGGASVSNSNMNSLPHDSSVVFYLPLRRCLVRSRLDPTLGSGVTLGTPFHQVSVQTVAQGL